MGEWYASLAKFKNELPRDVLVLPSHNDAFHGLHERLDALGQEQNNALERLRTSLAASPKSIVDAFAALFSRPIDLTDAQLLSLATGECIACMNYLMSRGEVRRRIEPSGVAWYSLS